MANQFIQKHQSDVNSAIEHFKTDIGSLRTGRANPALVQNVMVDCYGVKTPLMQLASISTPEPKQIKIEPWDKNLLKSIEKGISEANLGFAAVIEGNFLRITISQMTEEDRLKLVKILNEKLEAAKISMRSVREKIKDAILAGEKNKEIAEDDRYKFVDELDKEIGEWNKQLIEIAQKKEKEIMTV
jgi:ribosome recycling factor